MPVDFKLNGPIPGENLTSNRKNYPWHRTPDFTDTDQALDWIFKMMSKKEGSIFVLTMLGFGLPISNIVSILLMKGISQGKWSIDLALLLAGPLSHILMLLAKKEGVEYDLGIEDEVFLPTETFFSEIKSMLKPKDKFEDIKEDLKSVKRQKTLDSVTIEDDSDDEEMSDMGFMSPMGDDEMELEANG